MSPEDFRKISHPEPKILNSLVNCGCTHGQTHAHTSVNLELTPPEEGQLKKTHKTITHSRFSSWFWTPSIWIGKINGLTLCTFTFSSCTIHAYHEFVFFKVLSVFNIFVVINLVTKLKIQYLMHLYNSSCTIQTLFTLFGLF